MTDWVTKALGSDKAAGKQAAEVLDDSLLDEEMVVLLQGKNAYGDPIYSYLQLTLRRFRELREAAKGGRDFSPSEYGSVLAAGQGSPSAELRSEMAVTYNLIDIPAPQPPKVNLSQPVPDLWNED
jgi:hypothetical protein